MIFKCQHIYFNRRRCPISALPPGEFCRWHKIQREFKADLSGKREWLGRSMMLGAWSMMIAGGGSVWMFGKDGSLTWLLVAIVALGQAGKYFADSMIAADGPFSQFTVWPKILAFSMLSEAVCAAMLAFYIGANPDRAQPIVSYLGKSPKWIEYGPSVIAAFAVIASAVSLKMFVSRIWFRQIRYFGSLVFFATVAVVNWCLHPAVRKATGVTPESVKEFWEAVLGEHVQNGSIATWVLAFVLCELVNSMMRRRFCRNDQFKATTWPSFPACYIPPVLGMFAARYALVWCGISGVVPFVVLTLLVSGPICWIWTRYIIHCTWNSSSP